MGTQKWRWGLVFWPNDLQIGPTKIFWGPELPTFKYGNVYPPLISQDLDIGLIFIDCLVKWCGSLSWARREGRVQKLDPSKEGPVVTESKISGSLKLSHLMRDSSGNIPDYFWCGDGILMEKYVSGNSIGNGPDNKIMSPVIASIAYRQGGNIYCVKMAQIHSSLWNKFVGKLSLETAFQVLS